MSGRKADDMIDLVSLAMRKSVTVSDLKARAEEIHREIGTEGKLYTLRYGDHEDLAIVPLESLVALAREREELLTLLASLERQLAAQSGVPLLGGPDEDDLVRRRLSEERFAGEIVLAEARVRLGLV
jgi:hypothetical protein